jgi:hypothetical protein
MSMANKCTRAIVAGGLLVVLTGCGIATPSRRVEGLNVRRLPDTILAEPRLDKEPIDYVMLRQDPPEAYRLDEFDTLGVYIEGILGREDDPPPFLDDPLGNTPPAVGFPIPLQKGGVITLPLLDGPLTLKGLTILEAQEVIRKAYLDQGILTEDKGRQLIVSLYRPRTYQIIVIREDGGGSLGQGGGGQRVQSRDVTASLERGTGYILDMPAYENDVLRALMETGGLPGIDAKPEVTIMRAKFKDSLRKAVDRADVLKNLQDCELPPTVPSDPNVTIIPTRIALDEYPNFKQKDVILNEGDVVVVETRTRDVFYTGGLLGGTEVPLPRDYDLDVLSAVSIAGGDVGAQFRFGPGGNFGGFGTGQSLRGSTVAPTEITIIREAPFNNQIPIKINLRTALSDPSQRILIKPGDIVILNYTTLEIWGNLIVNTFPFNTLFDNLIFNR